MNSKIITVGQIKQLRQQGKIVKVKTIHNQFTKITNFIQKGTLDTWLIKLDDGCNIKASKQHKFFDQNNS